MSLEHDILSRLQRIAEKHSQPFCYSCYKPAPSGRCTNCMSDDLMRFFPGVAVEYGFDWVVEHLIATKLVPVDVDKAFEESISECYPEAVKIGWIEYDVASAIKELDPVSWRLALSEWIDSEVTDERLMTFDNGSTYFETPDVEQLILELDDT